MNCADGQNAIYSIIIKVLYRVPATGTRSPQTAYRQSLWLADKWHATGLQVTGAKLQHSRRQKSKWRRRSSD